jgi:hypothetical protein
VTDAPRALRVNASAITRTLPRHLREPFKRELTERLLARRGERVSVDDIRTIAADVLRGMARARELASRI